MSYSTSKLPRACRQHRLAACIAAIVSITTPVIALCTAVTNCNDSGLNSLRAAVANAVSGDTIDLTSLPCSTITLEDFQIVIPQQDLTIKGPTSGVTIAHDGNYDRVLNHQGSGTLKLENIHVTGGDPYSTSHNVNGGCIYSKANVYMGNSSVTNCLADTYFLNARGGGIYTRGDLTLVNSTVAGNRAGQNTYYGEGGGAHVGGNFTAVSSSIRDNTAMGLYSHNGGIGIYKSFSINESTISGNSAGFIGGLDTISSNPGFTGILENSTISGNHSTGIIGGAYLSIPTTVRNSTIAFNTAARGDEAPGLATGNSVNAIAIDLESSIISNNTFVVGGMTIENDLSTVSGGYAVVSGQHNLILGSSVIGLPPNVIAVASCPFLGPLRNNGGITQTHALLSHSPAIDAGSNPSQQQFDQRGLPYKRSDGLFVNFTDIGAYEVQQQDILFNTSFEDCSASIE